MGRRPIFRQSFETQVLVDLFRRLPLNNSMSYDDASKIVGFKVSSTLPAYQRAKLICERDHGVVISSIRKFGFQRIDGHGMVERGPNGFKRIRRISRREARVQEIALTQNLSRDDMLRATEQLTRYRLVQTTAILPPANNRRPSEEVKPVEYDPREAIRRITK